MRLRHSTILLAVLGLIAAACARGPSAAELQATIDAGAAATVAALPTQAPPPTLPPQIVTVVVTVEVTPVPPPTTPPEEAAPTAVPAGPAAPAVGSPPSDNPLDSVSGLEYKDDFGKVTNWWLQAEDDSRTLAIRDGAMHVVAKPQQTLVWTYNGQPGDDFYARVSASVGGCVAGDYYGMTFRHDIVSNANLYLFALSCEGAFKVMRDDGGEFVTLLDWTSTPVVNRGSNKTNELGVRARGPQIDFFVNGQGVASLTDGTYTSGAFGLAVRSYVTRNFEVVFDNVEVYSLR